MRENFCSLVPHSEQSPRFVSRVVVALIVVPVHMVRVYSRAVTLIVVPKERAPFAARAAQSFPLNLLITRFPSQTDQRRRVGT